MTLRSGLVLVDRLGIYDHDGVSTQGVYSGQVLGLGRMVKSRRLNWARIETPEQYRGLWVATGPVGDPQQWISYDERNDE